MRKKAVCHNLFIYKLRNPILRENILIYGLSRNIRTEIRMIEGVSPVMGAVLGTLFTWFVTAVGAAFVFLIPAGDFLLYYNVLRID